jgi:hypothetical protein
MLPVFLSRIRGKLNLSQLADEGARAGRESSTILGYFLELASQLENTTTNRPSIFKSDLLSALATLHKNAQPERPFFLFRKTAGRPFEAESARTRTPSGALRWGLLTGTPVESFSSYFRKASQFRTTDLSHLKGSP